MQGLFDSDHLEESSAVMVTVTSMNSPEDTQICSAEDKPYPRLTLLIAWDGEDLVVLDRMVKTRPGSALRNLGPAADAGVHSPSARTSSSLPADWISAGDSDTSNWADRLNRLGVIRLRTVYSKDSLGHLRFRSISEDDVNSISGCRVSVAEK